MNSTQKRVTTATCEAEYVALHDASKEALFIINIAALCSSSQR